MPAGLVVILGLLFALVLPLGLLFAALTAWALEPAIRTVRSLPAIGGPLGNFLQGVEDGLLGFARKAHTTGVAMWVASVKWLEQGIADVARRVQGLIPQLVQQLLGNVASIGQVLLLTSITDVDTKIPQVFRDLEHAIHQLPEEPAFRPNSPLRQLLDWLSRIWTAVRSLAPFARVVAAPVILALLALWGLVETIGRITRLETVQAGLVRFTAAMRADQLQDEHTLQQLFTLWNQTSQQVAILQVDLERERAARVAALQQEQLARHDAVMALEGQRAADRSQWSPLLILAVLASLGTAGVDILRKTAECDPCAQIDQSLSDLPVRVAALEAYGEP